MGLVSSFVFRELHMLRLMVDCPWREVSRLLVVSSKHSPGLVSCWWLADSTLISEFHDGDYESTRMICPVNVFAIIICTACRTPFSSSSSSRNGGLHNRFQKTLSPLELG